MKTNYLSGILSLLFCVVGLTNCNDHLVNPNEKDPEGGGGEGTEAWTVVFSEGQTLYVCTISMRKGTA